MKVDLTSRVMSRLSVEKDVAGTEDGHAALEVERSDYGAGVDIHTYVEGRGSLVTYELDREAAIGLVTRILNALVLD